MSGLSVGIGNTMSINVEQDNINKGGIPVDFFMKLQRPWAWSCVREFFPDDGKESWYGGGARDLSNYHDDRCKDDIREFRKQIAIKRKRDE